MIDDAKELDEFGARRIAPAGEVDQFGWRPAPPARLRDTTLDYQTIDLERACRYHAVFPCFTGTKIQILTRLRVRAERR